MTERKPDRLVAQLRVLTLTDIAMLSPVVRACRDERDALRVEVERLRKADA